MLCLLDVVCYFLVYLQLVHVVTFMKCIVLFTLRPHGHCRLSRTGLRIGRKWMNEWMNDVVVQCTADFMSLECLHISRLYMNVIVSVFRSLNIWSSFIIYYFQLYLHTMFQCFAEFANLILNEFLLLIRYCHNKFFAHSMCASQSKRWVSYYVCFFAVNRSFKWTTILVYWSI